METPREPPVVLESKPLKVPEEFESRRLLEENIIAALKDEKINIIGLCGVEGIGKTRMARRIGEEVKEENLFSFVVMVNVGPSSDVKRIIYEISDYLGVRLEGNFMATENGLLSRLLMGERILIILDDVWEILDLKEIGIPQQNHNGWCKIMITSRFESVCLEMGAHKIFTVNGLTKEEVWILLREEVGNSIDSIDLYPLARSIAEKCRGLPVALIAIGRMLKYQSKHWPGIVVAEKNLNPALSYRSPLLHKMVVQSSSLREGSAVDVLEAESTSVSFLNSFLEIIGTGINLIQGLERSQRSSIVSPPPKRGEIKAKILENLMSQRSSLVSLPPKRGKIKATILKKLISVVADTTGSTHSIFTTSSNPKINHNIFSKFLPKTVGFLPKTLLVLDLQDSDIQVLPGEIKKLVNLRLLNLTNCRNLQIIEAGLISSLVRLEGLYMLGSFDDWEVEKEGKIVGSASIGELELLPELTALQIQVRDPNIIPKTSRIWSRLIVYVISTPKELKCRFQESLHLTFPVVDLDNCNWQFRTAMDLYLPSLTSLADWLCIMLQSTDSVRLAGNGSKNAVDELIPEGFKLLKQLEIVRCSTMEYLVHGVEDHLRLTNGFLPVLESLYLEDLPMFMEIFHCQIPAGSFAELRHLKLRTLPALLHVCRSPAQSISFSNLRSVHIVDCPKLRSLFSLSMARDLVQLEEIKIEYCEMMEEIFSEERHEDGKISNKIEFSKVNCLLLDTLPNLIGFCKNVRIEFPELREMCIQSLRKLRTFCPTEGDIPYENNDDNGMQFLFNEQVAFRSLKKLEITELHSATGIWCHQPSTSLFIELEVLVVESCDSWRNLFSCSTAKVLVHLKHLIVEDCCMMQQVIAEDGETGHPEIYESLFPQLKKLELRRLPILESFCHMVNGLELPSLEDLVLYDCPEMKEFSRGQLNMPMLKCVKKDYSKYGIDHIHCTVQRLFNEKHLFIRQSWPLYSQYQDTEVEESVEEEVLKESIQSHSELSSLATRGNKSVKLQYDMNQKSFCSISRQSTTAKELDADPPENCCYKLRDERWKEDVSAGRFSRRIEGKERQKEEIGDGTKSEISVDMILQEKRYVKDCILFCSRFPSNYEFSKDMLVSQWIAEGLLKLGKCEIMEEVCIWCFDTLLDLDYIVPSGYDHYFDHMKYKVGDKMNGNIEKQLLEPKFRNYLESKQTDAAKVEYLSLAFKEIDHIDFGILKQCSRLQVLIIHRCYGSKAKQLPSDLFLKLKDLKILNLSHTNIVELPSSVEKLKELQYLEMSHMPITWLPESIHCLSNLQTLNLDGCVSLTELPKCTSKLINLQHLVVGPLGSMPIGIGKLLKLRTLRAFVVGEEDGSRIGELKDMNRLKGSLRILNLENVVTKEEAEAACLCNKQDLKKIELHWSDLEYEKNPNEEEILESLQPPFSIQELKIIFYSGRVLPFWISNPSFHEMVSITLYRCRYCDRLPSLGELPSLKLLKIVEINEVVEINSFFCRKQTDHVQHVAFPKLETLSFDSMSKLERWTGMENGDFPHLHHLIIEYCPKFVGLPFLSHLNSLLHMEISSCPELSYLPEGGLPPRLESLMIKDCPKLKERCCNEKCKDWSKVAHVPDLCINNQKVKRRLV